MTLHIFRSYAAGFFGKLPDDVRARLLAEVDAHDHLRAAYTPDGTLSYDKSLTYFRFRYEVRERADSSGEAREAMLETVRTKALDQLGRIGVAVPDPTKLQVGGTDMASIFITGLSQVSKGIRLIKLP